VPFEGCAHPFLVTETATLRDLINVEFASPGGDEQLLPGKA